MNQNLDACFSEAAERNKQPILEILRTVFNDRSMVLEVGSGTGQHAVFFAPILSHLIWQPTELPENLLVLGACCEQNPAPNLIKPIRLNVDDDSWPMSTVDAVFTANTLHIVSWQQVCRMFLKVGSLLPVNGIFCTYGPFNRDGCYTSASNEKFDACLCSRDQGSGIRDIGELALLAEANGLFLKTDYVMPVNNRLLVWHKLSEN